MAGTGTESHADGSTSDAADDFEFCILSSGALAHAGKDAGTDMCVADEVFSNGKLLPLRPSSAAGSDGPASTAGFGSRSGSRSASSSCSSSGRVSRSQSSNGASSDHGAAAPPRRSLPSTSSLFYAHPSPSPQLRRPRPRRSTGSAPPPPPAAWGILRLGVVGAPDVYPPRPGEAKNAAVAIGGGSRSARFEQASAAAADRKIGLGLFGDSLGCKCSPDAVEPVRLAAPATQGRKKDGVKVRRSRILHWLEEISVTKEK